ncbi:hypothetical protein SALBM135S_02012 [Streptomyces alboniger]
MEHGIRAAVLPSTGSTGILRASRTRALRAVRVDNSARDSVPDTGGATSGSPRR